MQECVCQTLEVIGGILTVWQWIEHCEDKEHGTSVEDLQCGSLTTDSALSRSDSEQNKSSTVSFKCVGVTRDRSYQEVLKTALTVIQEGKGESVARAK